MCILTGPEKLVIHVSNTQILAARLNATLHFIAYQNSVATNHAPRHSSFDRRTPPGGVAMILPVPIALDSEITLIDLSNYDDLFVDLARFFPPIYAPRVETLGPSFSSPQPLLPIERVGAYDVSRAGDLETLQRLDWTHYVLRPEVVELLRRWYEHGFGFVVAKLRDGAGRLHPHPLGYAYTPRDNTQLFIPTRHGGHDERETQTGMAEWDHAIFLYGDPLRRNHLNENLPFYQSSSGGLDVARLQGCFPLSLADTVPTERLTRMIVKGMHSNEDWEVRIGDDYIMASLPVQLLTVAVFVVMIHLFAKEKRHFRYGILVVITVLIGMAMKCLWF